MSNLVIERSSTDGSSLFQSSTLSGQQDHHIIFYLAPFSYGQWPKLLGTWQISISNSHSIGRETKK